MHLLAAETHAPLTTSAFFWILVLAALGSFSFLVFLITQIPKFRKLGSDVHALQSDLEWSRRNRLTREWHALLNLYDRAQTSLQSPQAQAMLQEGRQIIAAYVSLRHARGRDAIREGRVSHVGHQLDEAERTIRQAQVCYARALELEQLHTQ